MKHTLSREWITSTEYYVEIISYLQATAVQIKMKLNIIAKMRKTTSVDSNHPENKLASKIVVIVQIIITEQQREQRSYKEDTFPIMNFYLSTVHCL